jgi:hypothetical protein
VLDQGPSFDTKREEAREGMLTFLQQAPSAAPVVLDLISEAQDWPNSDKFAKRLKTLLPPQIQAMEAQESGEQPPPPPPPAPPPPEQVMEMESAKMKLQTEQIKAQADIRKSELAVAEKQIELRIKELELAAAQAAATDQIGEMQGQINQIVAALNGHAMQ